MNAYGGRNPFLALLLGLRVLYPFTWYPRTVFSQLQWLPYAGFLSFYAQTLPSSSLHCRGFFPLFFCISSNAWDWEVPGQHLILLQQTWWAWLNGHPSRCPLRNPSSPRHPPLTQFPKPQPAGSFKSVLHQLPEQLCILRNPCRFSLFHWFI